MKLRKTMFADIMLVIDEYDIPVAVEVGGKEMFRLYDTVRVKGDCRGYITIGIEHEGYGRIVEIKPDDTDHFYGVLMNGTNEFGFVKASRLEKI